MQEDVLQQHNLSIQIGDAVQIRSNAVDRYSYLCRIIGYLSGRSMIVSTPVDADPALLVKNKSLFVRGFSGRNMYEFDTRLVCSVLSPYGHLHLEYPEGINVTRMRGALRVRTGLHCFINPVSDKRRKVPGILEDISTTGARIFTWETVAELDDEVEIQFVIKQGEEEIPCDFTGMVRNLVVRDIEGKSEQQASQGIEFLDMDHCQSQFLQNFVCDWLVKQSRKKQAKEFNVDKSLIESEYAEFKC